MKTIRIFIIFAIISLTAIIYKTYEQYSQIENTQNLIILNESESISKFVLAFRQTYQDVFIRNNIDIDDKNINLLPVKTILEISKRFEKSHNGDISIRTVSDRPRNKNNMANSFEKSMIEYFKKYPNNKDNFIYKDGAYYYSKPMYIKQSCLRCHGKKESAIESIRKRYDSAYDYKLGDLRGLISIKIKQRDVFSSIQNNFIHTISYTIFLYILFLIIIYILIKKIIDREKEYTDTLEKEIDNKIFEIKKQKEAFEKLFEKSSDGIFIMHNSKFIKCNDKIVKLFKFNSRKELLNETPASLSPEFQPDGEKSSLKAKNMIEIANKEGWNRFKWLHKKANGNNFMAEVTLIPIRLDGKNVIHVILKDISYKVEEANRLLAQKEILLHQAYHDSLTGLPNRILFNDRLEHGIELAKRHQSNLALLFIDLDNFKKINDTLGHHIGDKVLKTVTNRLRNSIRKEDTVARLGGDEFTIIMEDLKDINNASILSKKILYALSQPMYINQHTLQVSCSIGISLYPDDEVEPTLLLKYADSAMYKAKGEGKNNFKFYSLSINKNKNGEKNE